MSSLRRFVIVLRLNLLLTLGEGAWVLWQFLKSPSDADAVVFLQYSASRLALLLFVLALLAGILFLLSKSFRLNWENQPVGKWFLSASDRSESFWILFLSCGVAYFLVFMPEGALGNLALYRGRMLPLILWLGISSAHWLASWLSLRWVNSQKNQPQTGALALLVVFVASRTVYDQIGFEFQTDAVNDYWQMIDPLLLQTDLWRSLLYLHSQPPMLNLFTGLVLQWFPAATQSVFHAVYFLTGLILAWSVYRLGLALELPTWLSFVASALFTISPPVALYEHWLFYTYPIAAALALTAVSLHRFHLTQKFGWGFLFFSLLAFVALTWSLFHFLWMLTIIAAAVYFMSNRKKICLAALLPLAMVVGWYGKNYILFGEFTASTWAGMNLSNVTTYRLPPQETSRMIESGALSPFAQIPSFSAPEDYLPLLPNTPTTGIPLLDMTKKSNGRINFHHVVYVEVNHFYLQDSLRVIRAQPALYLNSIAQSLYIFFHSASDYDFLDLNRARISAFETGWNRLFFGQWDMNESLTERTETRSLRHTGWLILLTFVIAACGSVRYLWKTRTSLNDAKNLLILFMGFNLLYLALIGNLFDLGENNRFRFVVDPFVLMLFLFVAVDFIRSRRVSKFSE
ncbi:MAG: hypothetical protein IT314_02255 [Anaerolineales bacterium]|nr:hypothetical protein [Anaerolineales bacterium]